MNGLSLALRKLLQWPASAVAPYFCRLPKVLRIGVIGHIVDRLIALRAKSLASSADQLLETGDVKGALAQLQECLALVPDTDDFEPFRIFQLLPLLAVTELQGFGRYDIAQAYFQEIQDRQDRLAKRLGIDHLRPAFNHRTYFGEFWTSHIGHLSALDAFVKRSILQGELLRGIKISLPPGRQPVNKALYAQWQKYGITADEEALPVPPWLLHRIEKRIFTFEYPRDLSRPYWESMADIHRDWDVHGLPPLFKLTDIEEEMGRGVLSKLGVPEDAWFVCLHVRAAGFKRSHEVLHAPLNADIETYIPMIREITGRGGWVIRLGDPSMPKLPPMQNVIDYAHSAAKSGAMDVFLSARCKFYVGTSSGLGFVPPLFGTPCVFTNWFPVGTRPFQPKDLYIFKLHRSIPAGKFVPFIETLAPPLGHVHSLRRLAEMGVELIDNSAEEITEVVMEMYEQTRGGGAEHTDEDDDLQRRFDDVAHRSRCGGSARLGREFLRRYAGLLPAA